MLKGVCLLLHALNGLASSGEHRVEPAAMTTLPTRVLLDGRPGMHRKLSNATADLPHRVPVLKQAGALLLCQR